MSEFQSESLSLEETNRLRVSLGLKPIAVSYTHLTLPTKA